MNCKSCQAEVLFVKSATSEKFMILNKKPEKRIIITISDDGVTPPKARIVDTYTDHHSTCPDAEKYRDKKTKNH